VLGGGVFLLAGLYIASFVVRHYGRRVEKSLWEKWGGPPSTRFLRWRDTTFGEEIKSRLHSRVTMICGITLYPKEEELMNIRNADEKINQAFSHVKAIVRREDPHGLWLSHNAEYGLTRNLYGSRYVWAISSLIGVLSCGVIWIFVKNDTALISTILNFIFFLTAILFGRYYLLKFCIDASNRYAESMWTTFLAITNKTSK
jgi:hypothetical protein